MFAKQYVVERMRLIPNWNMPDNAKRFVLCFIGIVVISFSGFLKGGMNSTEPFDDNENIDTYIQMLHDTSSYSIASEQATHWGENLTSLRKLVYNSVPKCGSATTSKLIKKLSAVNHYKVIFVLKEGPKCLNVTEQLKLVERTEKEKAPWIYIQHFHFINFTDFGVEIPVHINLIRDPIERKMSAYYYLRFKAPRKMSFERRNMTFDDCVKSRDVECTSSRNIFAIAPYFCGSHPKCSEPSVWSINRAKQNVIKYFSVVGCLEELEKFYYVLEKTIPQYFKGLGELYKKKSQHLAYLTSNKHPKVISNLSRLYLRSFLEYEYDFYYFVQNRFQQIYKRVQQTKYV